MNTAAKMLREAAAVNEAKNREYDKGHFKHGSVMGALFPTGVRLNTDGDFGRFAVLDLIVAKLVRYAGNFVDGHDDSLLDITVYAAMLRELDHVMLNNRSGAGAGADNLPVNGSAGLSYPQHTRRTDDGWLPPD